MHTVCAERYLAENFARCNELQNGLSGDFNSPQNGIKKAKPAQLAGFMNLVFQQLFVFILFGSRFASIH